MCDSGPMFLTHTIQQDPSCRRINWKKEKGKNASFLTTLKIITFLLHNGAEKTSPRNPSTISSACYREGREGKLA